MIGVMHRKDLEMKKMAKTYIDHKYLETKNVELLVMKLKPHPYLYI